MSERIELGDGATYERGVDPLSRAYRALPADMPSPAIDAALCAAARRQVVAGPQGGRRRTVRPRWMAPVASAAALLLTVGVGWRVVQEAPPAQIREAALPDGAVRAEAAKPGGPPAVPADARPPAPSAASLNVPQASVPASAAPPAGARAGFVPPPATVAKQDPRPVPRAAPAAPPTVVPAPAPAPAAEQWVARASAERAADAPVARRQESGPGAHTLASTPPVPAAPTPPPPAALPGASTVQAFPEARGNEAPTREDSRGALLPKSRAARAEAFRARDGAPAQGAAPAANEGSSPDPLTPEEWLRKIESLHLAGKTQEALDALARFRAEYPDHALPESVRRWAPPRP